MKFSTASLIALSFVICHLSFLGCSTTKDMAPMTSQEKESYAMDKASEWLSDEGNQNTVKQSLIVVGIQLLRNAASDQDRQTISNYMWASSVMFQSLATGQEITPENLQNNLNSFLQPSKSAQIAQYTAAINLAWQFVYTNLKVIKDPSLVKTWLLIFAAAGEEVAEGFTVHGQ